MPFPCVISVQDDQPQQEYEMDEWLVSFARAFSDITGIDAVS